MKTIMMLRYMTFILGRVGEIVIIVSLSLDSEDLNVSRALQV